MGNLFNVDVVGAADQLSGNHRPSTSQETPSVVNEIAPRENIVVEAKDVDFYYGKNQALKGVTIQIIRNKVTCLIGPSGCGKSTFLRSLNRMNDRITGARHTGLIEIDGENIYSRKTDLMQLRRKVGMVFQKPNPFPTTVYENIAMAPRIHYGFGARELNETVETALQKAALWDEVKDDYKRKHALALSGGQQQRLCIARTLAINPEIILMDEPCSALDPISTYKIEELIKELSGDYTLIVVTHNMHQAGRISSHTAFFNLGELVEYGTTESIFQRPAKRETEDYVSGRFG